MSSKIFGKEQRLNSNDRDDTLITQNNENFIYIASEYGLDKLRNTIIEENSATVTNPVGQNYYSYTSGTNANGKCGLETKTLSRFELNGEGESAVGFFLLATPTGNQFAALGLVDRDLTDGWYFYIDSTGILKVRAVRNSVLIFDVPQTAFNLDKLDGTGPSGINWTPTSGNVYSIKMTAQISDVVFGFNVSGKFIGCHRLAVPGDINDIQRYTQRPITNIIDNNGETTSLSALSFISYNIISNPVFGTKRITSITQTAIVTATGSGSWTPIFSIRRKSTLPNTTLNIQSMNTIQTNSTIYGVFLNATLNTPSWGDIIETDNNETSLEFDESSTTMGLSTTAGDGIVKIYSFMGEGSGTDVVSITEDLSTFKLTLGLTDTLTIGAITLAGAGLSKVILRMEELW